MGSVRVRNTEEYKNLVSEIWGGYFKYPNLVWEGNYSIVEFECPNCGTVKMKARYHKERGCECKMKVSKPRDRETLISELQDIHGDKYDYSKIPEGKFISNTEFTLVCPEHGEFSTSIVKAVHSKHGCIQCGIVKQVKSRTKTKEAFLEECVKKFGQDFVDRHDYSEANYKNNRTKIKFLCKNSGLSMEQIARNHIEYGCPLCNDSKIGKHTWETFIHAANIAHEHKYTYTKNGEFESVDKIIDITCPIHGVFQQKAFVHLNQSGCQKCNGGVALTYEEFLIKAKEKFGDQFEYSGYVNMSNLFTVTCKKHGSYEITPFNYLLIVYGCGRCAAEIQKSKGEDEIASYISSFYQGEIIKNTNKVLGNGKHLDLYIPEMNLAIEYNGLYWHSDLHIEDKRYHLDKTKICESKGIRLLHIWDKEWEEKKEIIKSKISSIFKKNTKIHARKTKIISPTYKNKNDFLNSNHIQGEDSSQIYYGLEYNGELVACMTFGKPRFNEHYDWELIRYCCKVNTNVIGGAGKLLNHFRSKHKGSIISYADRRISDGNLYNKLGFTLTHMADPSFKWYNTKNGQLFNRMTFHRDTVKKLKDYSEDLTVNEVVKINGIYRVWDCGNYVFGMQ